MLRENLSDNAVVDEDDSMQADDQFQMEEENRIKGVPGTAYLIIFFNNIHI